MTILALDVGEARIGLAKGRIGSQLAFAQGVISGYTYNKKRKQPKSQATLVTEIVDMVQAKAAKILVIGLPLLENGEDSAQTSRVRKFAAQLEQRLASQGVKVVLEDERFTSQIATQQLAHLPKGKRQQKARVDEGAAVLILQRYLNRQKILTETKTKTKTETN